MPMLQYIHELGGHAHTGHRRNFALMNAGISIRHDFTRTIPETKLIPQCPLYPFAPNQSARFSYLNAVFQIERESNVHELALTCADATVHSWIGGTRTLATGGTSHSWKREFQVVTILHVRFPRGIFSRKIKIRENRELFPPGIIFRLTVLHKRWFTGDHSRASRQNAITVICVENEITASSWCLYIIQAVFKKRQL